jgi:heme/copper-type cytochrome/quinol oxidase subunit 2
MYCSSCGGAVARDLTYCNHCGAKLGGIKDDLIAVGAEPRPELLVCAMVVVFAVGLGGTIGLMAVMKDVFGSANPGLIIAFTLLTLVLTVAVEGLLVGLLMSQKRRARKGSEKPKAKEQTTNELGTAQPRVLQEHMPSVTEHTTRAFEPVYTERKAE